MQFCKFGEILVITIRLYKLNGHDVRNRTIEEEKECNFALMK
jgi:hypothetical protein